MSLAAERARSAWLLSFGDVVTLLITFFIMAIALNKGEISQIQKWAEAQLDESFQILKKNEDQFSYIKIHRNSLGIVIVITDSSGFDKGGFKPSTSLTKELRLIAANLHSLPIFNVSKKTMPSYFKLLVAKDNLVWRMDVTVAGYTDNDKIDPRSSLRNNWFLSTMRAQQVMQILQQNSAINPDVFNVAGYGQYRPLVPNNSAENKAKNRRVEVVLTATFEKKQA